VAILSRVTPEPTSLILSSVDHSASPCQQRHRSEHSQNLHLNTPSTPKADLYHLLPGPQVPSFQLLSLQPFFILENSRSRIPRYPNPAAKPKDLQYRMPLFTRHADGVPVQEKEVDPPKRRSTLFGRNRDVSPASTTNTRNTTQKQNSAGSGGSPHRRSGLLHRRDEDPSIIAARERVMSAEAAERDADRALAAAKYAVREAREHIKRLEREAAEE